MIWYPEALSTEWSNLAAHGLHQRAGRFFMGIPTHKIQNPKNPGFPHGSNRMFWLPIPSEKNRIVVKYNGKTNLRKKISYKNKTAKRPSFRLANGNATSSTSVSSLRSSAGPTQIKLHKGLGPWSIPQGLVQTTDSRKLIPSLPKSSQAEHQHKTKNKDVPSISKYFSLGQFFK